MAYIVAGAMPDSSEQWLRSMETVTAGETAKTGECKAAHRALILPLGKG